jgi:threonylcarbamoyladenosine tRNA methylthiotransferase MtaB
VPEVLIHTLGCKLNSLESESYADSFRRAGYELFIKQKINSKPAVVIINTCTVTSKADQKARRVIRKALRDYPKAKIIVTGCYAELEKEGIEKLLTAENSNSGLLVLKREEVLNFFNDNNQSSKFQFVPEQFSVHTRSILKIQDGCNNKCTYCRIRLARGPSESLPAEQVLERLLLLEQTYAEAVLTGVNISQYSSMSLHPSCENLTKLLSYLIAGTQKIALRLSSLDPLFITKDFAKSVSGNRIRPHFHLSIQSCSQIVLQRMGRSYNANIIENAVSFLRGVKDDPFIACDIITGFPGETEAEFNKTYELCKKLQFAWIHVFPYSKRPGTPAFDFSDTVQESEVTRRVQLLTELAWHGRAEYVKKQLGKEVEVLIENSVKSCRGVSANYLKVLVKYKGKTPPPSGAVLRCRLPADQKIDCKNEYDAIALEI